MFDSRTTDDRKQMLGLLANPWAIGCMAALLIQQIIEASCAVWLVYAMESITAGKNFFPYLCLYFFCIAIHYIPNGIAFILKTTWKQEAQRSFINEFVASNKANVGEWNNRGLKEQKLSILTSEGPAAINLLIDYIWDLSSY